MILATFGGNDHHDNAKDQPGKLVARRIQQVVVGIESEISQNIANEKTPRRRE